MTTKSPWAHVDAILLPAIPPYASIDEIAAETGYPPGMVAAQLAAYVKDGYAATFRPASVLLDLYTLTPAGIDYLAHLATTDTLKAA